MAELLRDKIDLGEASVGFDENGNLVVRVHRGSTRSFEAIRGGLFGQKDDPDYICQNQKKKLAL